MANMQNKDISDVADEGSDRSHICNCIKINVQNVFLQYVDSVYVQVILYIFD